MSSSNPEKPKSDHERRERQDWGIVLLILLIGFLCVLVAGQQAMSFAPRWTLDANVESNIDLNSEFLTSQPDGYFEPLDPAILTQPGWASVFLTPGAPIPVGTSVAASAPTGTTAAEPTATLLATNTLPVVYTSTTIPTNTLVWLPLPATNTPKPKDPPADPPTDTPVPTIDLEISMDDAGTVTYSPNTTLRYTITVRNNSTSDVNSVLVRDVFSVQIDGVSWTCAPSLPTMTCASGAGNPFSDTINLPAGSSVQYFIDAHISLAAMGPLLNVAEVTRPAGYNETVLGNNRAEDTNGDPAGSLNIGSPDGIWSNVSSGGTVTMVISPAINPNGTNAPDFVYYERVAPSAAGIPDPHVDMDWVRIDISPDNSSWTTVFYWGDPGGNVDGNTNVPIPVGAWCPTEIDNCHILNTDLYLNSTGIAIDIDSLGLTGSYPWIQITCPAGEDGDGCDIDSILLLP